MNRSLGFSLFVVVLLALVGCGETNQSQATATPTPVYGVVDAGVELIRQDMYLRLTQQYIENERIEAGARMTATQQVISAAETSQRRADDAQSTVKSERSTQQVWGVTVEAGKAQDTATAQANATATQAAVLARTATFVAESTAVSAQQTQQAPAMYAQQTAVFAQARQTEIELQKSTATMWVSAWGGWVFAVIVIIVAVLVVWKKSQVGVIPTDQNGRAQMVVINQGGQRILVSPGLMASPMLAIDGQGGRMPMLVEQAFQEKTTHGAQVIEAVRALPQGYQRQAMGLAGGLAGPTSANVNIQVVQPGQVQGWIEDVQGQISEVVEED